MSQNPSSFINLVLENIVTQLILKIKIYVFINSLRMPYMAIFHWSYSYDSLKPLLDEHSHLPIQFQLDVF